MHEFEGGRRERGREREIGGESEKAEERRRNRERNIDKGQIAKYSRCTSGNQLAIIEVATVELSAIWYVLVAAAKCTPPQLSTIQLFRFSAIWSDRPSGFILFTKCSFHCKVWQTCSVQLYK